MFIKYTRLRISSPMISVPVKLLSCRGISFVNHSILLNNQFNICRWNTRELRQRRNMLRLKKRNILQNLTNRTLLQTRQTNIVDKNKETILKNDGYWAEIKL